ncbi:MAG: glycosyltransferase [Crocinitomicaceae bacterium]
MKVLLVTHKPFLPTIDGGNAATLALVQQLIAEGVDLDYLTLCSEKHPFKKEVFAESSFSQIPTSFSAVDLRFRPLQAILSLFRGKSYHLNRFESFDLVEQFKTCVEKSNFDILLFDSLFSAQMIEQFKIVAPKKTYVLRTHNVEHVIWEKKAKSEKNTFKKFYLSLLANQLKKREIEILNQFDVVLPISQLDGAIFEKITKVKTINFPYFPDSIGEKWKFEANRCFHFGAMNWHPNQESYFQLTESIFPEVQKQCPALELFVAGSFMEKLPQPKDPNIHHLGFVEDKNVFLCSHGPLLAPISSGSGVRIKIIEALSMGVPVITTKQGMEGIPIEDGEGILICATQEEFILKTIDLCKNQEKSEHLSRKALEFMEKWQKNTSLLTIFEANV